MASLGWEICRYLCCSVVGYWWAGFFVCFFLLGFRCFWDPRGGGPRIFELPDFQIGLKGQWEWLDSHGNESMTSNCAQ